MAGSGVDGECYSDDGKLITILSIDGGGVRGIIPGKILEFLEKQLQLLDGPDARIYKYFDMISGTSTGGLIAAMLATPKPNSDEPIIEAKDICQFYIDEAPKIYSDKEGVADDEDKNDEDENEEVDARNNASLLSLDARLAGLGLCPLFNPKYNGKYLHKLIREKVGERKVAETLTNVLITSFDITLMKPSIFSTIRAKGKAIENVLMSDAGISTTAAPIFFPPHYFENSVEGETLEFNVADGCLAANNPTLLGICEIAAKESKGEGTSRKCSNQVDKFLVLSLGTGELVSPDIHARDRKWGILDWVYANWMKCLDTSYPLIDASSNASDRMVDIYTTMYLQDKITSKDNFLRVQYKNLPSDQAILDNAKPENLANLEKLGEDLLKQPVASMDLVTEEYIIQPGKTNEEALIELAKRLVENRHPPLKKM